MNPGPPPFHDGVHLWRHDPRPGLGVTPGATTPGGPRPRTAPDDAAGTADQPAPGDADATNGTVPAGPPAAVLADPAEVLVFSLLSPPPVDPPVHASHPHLWRIQLHWWWRHTPAHLAASCCAFCTRPWPCPSWLHWDDLLRHNTGAA